jgi:CRP-like cAMP-binding protein
MLDLQLVGPMERALHLRSLAMFEGLGGQEIAVLAQLMREEDRGYGSVLCQDGVPPSKLHLLVEGRVANSRRGRQFGIQKAPALLGLSGALGGRRASVQSVAESPVTLLSLDTQDFLDVLEDRFAIFLQLRHFYASHVSRLQRRLGLFRTEGPVELPVLPTRDRPLGIVEQLLCLRKTMVFHGIPLNVLAQLIHVEGELRMPAGETLWSDGDPGTRLITVVHGQVRCGGSDRAGEFAAGPGTVLGADAAFGGIPYAYDAVAETDIVAVSIDASALTDVIEDHFELGRRTLAHFAQEDVRLQEHAAGKGAHS